jgi:hypothetical protein
MRKKKLQPISLHKETIRILGSALGRAGGGVHPFPTSIVDGCPTTPGCTSQPTTE